MLSAMRSHISFAANAAMNFSSARVCLLFTLFCLFVEPLAALANTDDWKPIDPSEISLKASAIEKEADAEGHPS